MPRTPSTPSDVRYAIGDSSLGRVLVAMTGETVCAVLLGDEDRELVEDIEHRCPGAQPASDGHAHGVLADAIACVEEPWRGLGFEVAAVGTAFQRTVWQALRRIPAGTTVTYAELAVAAGVPSAVRAVASACGANPLAVVVPCHRVVRSDGSLSGYRWGVERKASLLARERAWRTAG